MDIPAAGHSQSPMTMFSRVQPPTIPLSEMTKLFGAAAGTGTEQMSINNAISIPVTLFVAFVVLFVFFMVHSSFLFIAFFKALICT